ncbi:MULTISPECIES: LysR family transcriptional regulator [Sorangium]|uniref:LysR family transcriptional regulator n=1 Tax=Sorangium cellulosum TaxID=56 RepID=A0A4P2QV59_SORCE|nr:MULTISPECIES: LysR family transcriptional regulator [Sorangium]AUX34300.1 LysR family transcriptional regulator [Sorangium cellulosum]WCQ93618.1 HTH-type transcriptional regulator MetR [Sorangium sp. Soce836]
MSRIAALPAPPAIGPRPQLEIRDLELVVALSAAGSTAGAASAMHITQSAVSRALAQAEERVGARLFERTARGVTPTAAGERLIAGAGLILAQLRELELEVAAPAAPTTRVRLVCECYTAYRWLPSAMAGLRRRLPRLEVELAVEHTQDPVGALVRGDIDVALLTTASLPGPREGGGALAERPLFSDEVVFVVSTSHPLAGRGSLTRDHLRKGPLITSNTPPAEARWFMGAVFGRKRPRLEFLRFPLTEAVIDAARAGMGIAVLSEWMAHGYLADGDLTVKRLSSGPLRRPWRIACRRASADAAERLSAALEGSAPRLYTRAG